MYWKKYSESINAEYVERKYWHSSKAVYNYKEFKLVFDNHTINTTSGRNSIESTVTRIYCQFESKNPLHLVIQKSTLFVKFLSLFKGNKLKSGHEEFDTKYIMFSNGKMATSFLSTSIRNKIINYKVIDLYIHDKNAIWGESLDKNNYELSTYIDASQVEIEVLNKFKNLFEDIINSLIVNYQISPISQFNKP